MSPHEFFNLLEGRISLYRLGDDYPEEFAKLYNESVDRINELASKVLEELQHMHKLQLAQFPGLDARHTMNTGAFRKEYPFMERDLSHNARTISPSENTK